MKGFVITGVALLLLSISTFAGSGNVILLPGQDAGVNIEIAKKIHDSWKEFEKGNKGASFYTYRVSPPFPEGKKKVYYIYVAGTGEVSDGEKIKGIWGKVIETADGQTFEQTVKKFSELKDIGTQGVRPVSSVAGKGGSPDICEWIKNNGVISAAIRPMHEAYFKSLKCAN